jgi:DNA replication and repair protein RecF
MFLESLELKNFRLHKNSSFTPSEKLNFLVGKNAQGKTTVLETIYLICTTKSYITNSLSEAVSVGENSFLLDAKIKTTVDNNIRFIFDKVNNNKIISKNNKQIRNPIDIIGFFPVIVLSPDDHEITKGTPKSRRKFIDGFLSQINQLYFEKLIDYNKILKNRAILLANYYEMRSKKIYEELYFWTERLAEIGDFIITERENLVKTYNEYLTEIYKYIMQNKENPEIKYKQSYNSKKSLKEFLFENLNNEINKGQNLYGPHRDDLAFYINGMELKNFGSQGQHKTFLASLKFAQYFYYKDYFNKDSIFLMDDIFGELDFSRASRISEYLNKLGQTFITITDFKGFDFLSKIDYGKVFNIENGKISS